MFIRTFVTVPVISLLIFIVMVDLFFFPKLNTNFEDCTPSVVQCSFPFCDAHEEGFKIASACSIPGYLLIFQLN